MCHLDSDLSRQYSPLLCSVAQTDAHPSARVLALKALFDLALRHGPECLNLEKGAEQGPVSGEAGLASGEGSPGSRAESFQSALSSRGTSFRSAVSDAAELMETARSPFPRGRVAQDESNVTSAGVNASSGAKPFETDSLAFLAQFLDPETLETDPGELERRGKRPKSGRGKKGAGEKVARGLEGLGREAVEVAAEGFAKLLLFDRVANAPDALGRLLLLYFDPLTEPCLRLRQCLAVFFDYYAAASAEHKVRVNLPAFSFDVELTSSFVSLVAFDGITVLKFDLSRRSRIPICRLRECSGCLVLLDPDVCGKFVQTTRLLTLP